MPLMLDSTTTGKRSCRLARCPTKRQARSEKVGAMFALTIESMFSAPHAAQDGPRGRKKRESNVCFGYSNGFCARGDKCNFAHTGPQAAPRVCHRCKKPGHIVRDCPERAKLFDVAPAPDAPPSIAEPATTATKPVPAALPTGGSMLSAWAAARRISK